MGTDPRTAWRRFFERELRDEVRALARNYPSERSLAVDAIDLHAFDATLADQLFTAPDRSLAAAEAALRDLHEPFDRVQIRPENYPDLRSVRALRSDQRAELVAVEGIVETRQPVRSKVAVAVFACEHCGDRTVRRPRGLEVTPPRACPACGVTDGLAFRDGPSTFVDVRRVELADPEGSGTAADAERWTVDVCLADELVEAVAPGDGAIVTGILRVDGEPPVNRFDFLVEALAVDTAVAFGSAPEPQAPGAPVGAPDEAPDGDGAVDGDGDLKAVLDAHWRDAVDEAQGRHERSRAPTGRV